MMLQRSTSRLLSKALQRYSRQIPRRTSRGTVTTRTTAIRCFSSNEKDTTKDSEDVTTITFTDDASAEHPHKKVSTISEMDIAEFTQEVKITMPDMGESTGIVRLRLFH